MRARKFVVETKAYIATEKKYEEYMTNALKENAIVFDKSIDNFNSSYREEISFSLFHIAQKIHKNLLDELLEVCYFIYTETPEETQEPSEEI